MNKERKFYIYGIFRPDNNELFYIGKGTGWRHLKSARPDNTNSIKNRIIKKIIKEGKEPIPKILFDNMTEEEAYSKEVELINEYGRISDGSGTLANLSLGGEGGLSGVEFSEEHKKNMSIAKIGSNNPMFGVKLSKEQKRVLSEIRKGNKNHFFGKSHKEESKEKMRKAKEKLYKPLVIDGVNYKSLTEASEKLKIHKPTISSRCKNSNFPNYKFKTDDIV